MSVDGVELVNRFRFLGINITENLSWTSQMFTPVKMAQIQLYFLRKLKKAISLCQLFVPGGIESILTGNITN